MNHIMTVFNAEGTYGTYGRRDRIRTRRNMIGCGIGFTVALHESGVLRYAGDNRWGQKDSLAFRDLLAVYCGPDYVLGLTKTGDVLTAGRAEQHGIKVNDWVCVTTVACGSKHAAALLDNGQVLASGDNRFGQCETDTWVDMADVCCGKNFTVGLRQNGTLLVAGGHKGLSRTVERWDRVAGIFADAEGRRILAITFGEGRLISSSRLPACTKKWRNLVYATASSRGIVAVTATGHILTTHKADQKRLNVMEKDYLSCAAGDGHLAVLCRSGEVISLGHNDFGQCNTARWGKIFRDFEAFDALRKEHVSQKKQSEKHYQQRLCEAGRFQRRLSCGERLSACIQADGYVSTTAGLRRVKRWHKVTALSCGGAHVLALHSDGTVSADGNNVGGCCRVSEWQKIKAISAGKYHSLGLSEDGSVRFAGWNVFGQGNVEDWKQVRLLKSTDTYTVAVTYDGKLLASGKQLPFDPERLDMTVWANVTDLAVSEHHMVGLCKNGRVIAVGDATFTGRGENGELTDVSSWHGVRSIAVGNGFTVALTYGGHVMAAGRNDLGQCDTGAWKHVVLVSCGDSFTVGLLADGHVVTAGQHKSGKGGSASTEEIFGAVMAWEKEEVTGYEPFHTQWMADVLTLQCGKEYFLALDRYGQVMAEGLDLDGQCTQASSFMIFRDIHQLDGFGIYNVTSEQEFSDAEDEKVSAKESYRALISRRKPDLVKKRNPQNLTVAQTRTTDAARRELRLFGESLSRRIFCGDRHVTVIKQDGRVISCLLSRGRLLEEAPLKPPSQPYALVGDANKTVILYGDGRARQRTNFQNPSAIESLPYELGTKQLPVAQVVEGKACTAILLKDGHVRLVGKPGISLPDLSLWEDVQKISVGDRHLAALTRDGCVLSTLLVKSSASNRVMETRDWHNVTDVVCGPQVIYGLCRNGEVLVTGDGTLAKTDTKPLSDAVTLVTSGEHTVALMADGRVTAIGKNDNGECEVTEWADIIMVAALKGLTLGLTADGRVLSAGKRKGELSFSMPVYSFAVFGQKQAFVTADGLVRIAMDEKEKAQALPVSLALFGEAMDESILMRRGSFLPPDMIARTLTGAVAVGLDYNAYLTDEGHLCFSDPHAVDKSETVYRRAFTWISGAHYHAMAVTADGRLMSFGAVPEDRSTALLDALSSAHAPHDPENDVTNWVSVFCGLKHTAALRGDGKVFAVGLNTHGQCDTDELENVSMVACGGAHTAVIYKNGKALAVGDNTYGQCDVEDWRDLVMIACGERHTVGLRHNGRVVAVGDDRLGQCRTENAKRIISVACLPEATVCVRNDGLVELYGGTGELKERLSALRDIVCVYTCEYRLCALRTDGRVIEVN